MLHPFIWPPPRRKHKLIVFLPASLISVEPTLREKTEVIGELARILAIFRVDEVIVFKDDASNRDFKLFTVILKYLLIPPYLRKKLVPITPQLKYAGLLPPLNVYLHNPINAPPKEGDFREGIVVSSWSGGGKVYIGSRQYFTVRSVKRLALGERVLVRIVSIKPPRAKLVVPEDVEIYIGYKVIEIEDINDLVEYLNTKPQIKVVMSKEGNNYGDQKLRRALLKEILRSEGIILMFGNPKKDPDEILPKEAIEAINPRFRINIIPYQGVLSVRTLEAIHTTLSILNIDLFQYEIQKTNKA
jgi:hypothetical protein